MNNIKIDDHFSTNPSYPYELNKDLPGLKDIINWVGKSKHVKSFLILHNNKLIVEKYFNGTTKDDKSDVFSVSKSVTSLLIGIALQKKLIRLNDPISKYTRVNEHWSNTTFENEKRITISHMLNMTCGLNDEMKYVTDPGKRWHYNLGSAWHMLKEVVQNVSRTPLQTIADQWLFSKLNITPIFKPRQGTNKLYDLIKAYVQNYYKDIFYNNGLSPINIGVSLLYMLGKKYNRLLRFITSYLSMFTLLTIYEGYTTYRKYSDARKYFLKPTTSLHCSGMDCIRLGQLILNNGINIDTKEQIIDREYINSCKHATTQDLNPSYSNMFWLNGKGKHINPISIFSTIDPEVIYEDLIPSAPSDLICFMGYNTQRIYVCPSLNIVVVRQGDEESEGATAAKSEFDEQLWNALMALFNKMNKNLQRQQMLTKL